MLPEAQHGDLALTRGLKASQIEVTQQVKSKHTSKTHDLIVLQIDLENLPPHERPSQEPWSDERLLQLNLAAYNAMTAQSLPNPWQLNLAAYTEEFLKECETLNLLFEETRAQKFLGALEDAAHKRSRKQ